VNGPVHTPAENTAAILQDAAATAVPVMIPGAWEWRLSTTRPIELIAASGTSHAHPVAMGAHQRLEYEREGGGGPSERRRLKRQTILARLWHSVVDSTGLSMTWRPATR
jgi:hypothetical protein